MVAQQHEYDTVVGNGALQYGMAQFTYTPAMVDFFGSFLQGWYGHTGRTFGFITAAYINQEMNGAAFAYVVNDCAANLKFPLSLLKIFTEDLKTTMSTMGNNAALSPAQTPTDGPASDGRRVMPLGKTAIAAAMIMSALLLARWLAVVLKQVTLFSNDRATVWRGAT